jgi:hypothetical protein
MARQRFPAGPADHYSWMVGTVHRRRQVYQNRVVSPACRSRTPSAVVNTAGEIAWPANAACCRAASAPGWGMHPWAP